MTLPTLTRPDGSPLFVLAGQVLRDGQGKTIGRASGRSLEVGGRRRGRVDRGQVLDARDQPLLTLDGETLRAMDGRVLAHFVDAEDSHKAVLSLAYATFGDPEGG